MTQDLRAAEGEIPDLNAIRASGKQDGEKTTTMMDSQDVTLQL